MTDLRYSTIETDIPIPAGRNKGLTEMLKKLEFGHSILVPASIKVSSIYPTAARLGFKVRTKKEYGDRTRKVMIKGIPYPVDEPICEGIRVWRITE